MQSAIIEITPAMEPYVNKRGMWLKQRAMLLYPYIQNGTISHGRAAEILELDKWYLIQLYGSMGIPYIARHDGMNFYKSDAKSDIHLRNVQKPKSRKGVPYDPRRT